jgi:YD repeat-containing protein
MSSPRNCVRPTWLLLAASLSALNFVGALGCGDHDGHDQKCTPKTCEALGAKCGQLSDGCSATLDCGSCTAPETCGGGGQANVCGIGLTPDPVTVAPKLDPTVATDIADSTAFLYTGDHPIQVGVAAGTIEKRRVVVIRGSVEDRDGQPMPEVTVAFLGHPELGHTSTRADGMYDLAANGGGLLTLTLEKAGFLTSQRAVQTPWRDFVWAPKVTLVPLDPNVTTVDLSAPGLQVARGSVVTDEDGSRQATVLVPAGTAAEMVLPDGSKQSLTTLHLRATEYTVGEAGPEAMPAPLPPSSGYTYAVELSADEAVGARATNLRFSQPVVVYVENFLGFPVGGVVPVGYYDRQEGQWVASSNGRVIKVVGVASGMADLDLDGDGAIDGASSLSTLGITDDERTRLARLYPTGQSLWRVAISHFTPLDLNWAYGPPRDATPPPDQDPEVIVDDPDKQCGSIIGCQDQTLGEVLPVAGTPFSLHYKSDRTRGRKGAYSLEVQLSKGNTPATLSRIRVEVRIAGRLYQAAYAPAPSLKYSLEWDGKDAYGRIVQGSQPADVRLYYDYAPVYYPVSQVANSFARAEAIAAASPFSNVRRAASTFTLAKNWTRSVGAWDARGWGLGGWGLSVQHAHDSLRHNLLLGNGDDQSERSLISTIAGTGTYVSDYTTGLGDGGPAIAASFGNPSDVAVGPDGSLYVSDGFAGRVRRVAPDGIISNFAGDGSRLGTGYGGDGGLATAAALNYPSGLALGRDGSVYIADSHNDRIRRVGPDGIITTVAGIGTKSCGAFSCIPAVGDGGPAIAAELNSPRALALGPDGSLYVAEMYDRIRRVGTDGIITTVAGTGTEGYGGDGGPATEALLYAPRSMAIGPDGSLFIADSNNFRIRRVGTDGIITTVAGTGASGYSGEGGPATAAMLNWPSCVAVGPDGSLFIADSGSGSTDWTHDRIRRVGPDGIITTIAGTGASGFGGDGGLPTAAGLYDPRGLALAPDGSLYIADRGNLRIRRVAPSVVASSEVSIASANGAEVFVFTSSGGRHIKTLDSLAGASRYELGYDAGGYLTSVTDSAGNVTTIERTGATATAIVAPFGQHTVLSVNPDGWLTGLTDPAGLTRVMDYSADGLLGAAFLECGKLSIITAR